MRQAKSQSFDDYSHWSWILLMTCVVVLSLYVFLYLWGDKPGTWASAHPPHPESPPQESSGKYTISELLKDGADIALKVSALIGGLLTAYKYLYRRYEPLVYFAVCGLIRRSYLRGLHKNNHKFDKICKLNGQPFKDDDEVIEHIHELPLVLLHKSKMHLLGIDEGDKVDLEFTTPDGRDIWAIAYAFSYESIAPDKPERYADEPVGLSLSLRRFFRMERPFQCKHENHTKKEIEVPDGWQQVKHNASDLAKLNTFKDNCLVWIVSSAYTVRFRDPTDKTQFFADDSLDPHSGRIMEYVGISLRVLQRNWFRYKTS